MKEINYLQILQTLACQSLATLNRPQLIEKKKKKQKNKKKGKKKKKKKKKEKRNKEQVRYQIN